MWHGVPSEYPTGYGVQTKLFTKALKDAGHEVFISSITSGLFTYTDCQDIRVLAPGGRGSNGNDFILSHCQRHKPDVVISMFDTFIVDRAKFAKLPCPWLAWQTIDCAPLDRKLKPYVQCATIPLAMSQFGQRTMAEAGIESTYVPLAIDSKDYHWMDKSEARRKLADIWKVPLPPGKKLVVMVAGNMSKPSRKNFYGAFRAWKGLLSGLSESRRKDHLLYCHTEGTGMLSHGEDLFAMIESFGIPEENIMLPDQYLYNQSAFGPDYMRMVYAAADLLLCSSVGEGFGVPIVEAQACGCPVLVPDNTSCVELVDDKTGVIMRGCIPICSYSWPESSFGLIPPAKIRDLLDGCLSSDYANDEQERIDLAVRTAHLYDIREVMRLHMNPLLKRVEEGKKHERAGNHQGGDRGVDGEAGKVERPAGVPGVQALSERTRGPRRKARKVR
jgi:glycosyltransferase involved in cell wall biosynthesis